MNKLNDFDLREKKWLLYTLIIVSYLIFHLNTWNILDMDDKDILKEPLFLYISLGFHIFFVILFFVGRSWKRKKEQLDPHSQD